VCAKSPGYKPVPHYMRLYIEEKKATAKTLRFFSYFYFIPGILRARY
jgi:hypothetical protein